jgi:hypothetical protein
MSELSHRSDALSAPPVRTRRWSGNFSVHRIATHGNSRPSEFRSARTLESEEIGWDGT